MSKKRVYNFKSFNKKVEEGYENPGFIVNEFEEENEQNVDSLGEGEDLANEESFEEAPVEDAPLETEPVAEVPAENIDFGDRQDITPEDVKLKTKFISDQLNSYKNLVNNMENVPLDKTTKEKIVKIYNVIQGI